MASVVDICNKALSLMGQKSIISLDDESPEGYACRTHWIPLRDEVLRGHPWNCVIRRMVLTRLVEVPANEYSYYYQLPSTCLMVLEVFPEQFFTVEGRKILCDSPELSIRYIEADDDTTQYDPQLAAGLAFRLAAELCYQMTSSTSLMAGFQAEAKEKLADAKASDSIEGKTPNRQGKNWLNAKYGRR